MRTQNRKGSHHPPASNVYSPLYQCMLQLEALSSLLQRGTDLREFALEFRSAADGLGYNDSALKDLFNYALDEPISHWRMLGSEHLSFEGFVEYLVRSGRQPALQREGLSHGEPLHAMATSPELLHRMAASPKPLCMMAATPDSPVITSPMPKASAIMDTVSVFPGTMSVSYEAIKVGPRLWRLASSLADPPLSSVQAAVVCPVVPSLLVQEDPTPAPAHNPPDAAESAHDPPDAAVSAHDPPDATVSAHDPPDAAAASAHDVSEAAAPAHDVPEGVASARVPPEAAEPAPDVSDAAVSAHDLPEVAASANYVPEAVAAAHDPPEAVEPAQDVSDAAVSAHDPPDAAAMSAYDVPQAAAPAHDVPEAVASTHGPPDAAVSAHDRPDAAVPARYSPKVAMAAPALELCTCPVTARVVMKITIVPFDSEPPW
ncbi:thioredoxin domain-containing 3 -like protein [Labeo rohita]|uniref:Thioredoxin domain-containing 3-like protein n=1 Tax=Labeo rohita TaxID=84645 RepID=A0A498LMY6_LABRO|nr:thioredoxin domain-containing 3 -like protein [Labeo rohita]